MEILSGLVSTSPTIPNPSRNDILITGRTGILLVTRSSNRTITVSGSEDNILIEGANSTRSEKSREVKRMVFGDIVEKSIV